MTRAIPKEQRHDPVFRTIDLSAEIKKSYGPEWNQPEIAYEFNGKKFYLRTEIGRAHV